MKHNKFLNKDVHVDFINSDTGETEWIEGTFTDYQQVENRDDVDEFIEIENDTDFNRINVKDVKKIYLKT